MNTAAKRKQKEVEAESKFKKLREGVKSSEIAFKKKGPSKAKTIVRKNDITQESAIGNKDKTQELQMSTRTKKGRSTREHNLVSNMAKEALGRGGGRACVATHANGCRHYGILDLLAMDNKNYLYYIKNGGWLRNKICIKCNVKAIDMPMDKGTKCYLRYCEMGLKGAKYNKNGTIDEKAFFEDHDCNMVLCVACWNKRVEQHEKEVKEKLGVNRKRCSARKRF